MKKSRTRNPVSFLVNEARRSPAWVASASNASYRSIENWLTGKPISRYYRPVLERLAKREQTRLAAQIIKNAGDGK